MTSRFVIAMTSDDARLAWWCSSWILLRNSTRWCRGFCCSQPHLIARHDRWSMKPSPVFWSWNGGSRIRCDDVEQDVNFSARNWRNGGFVFFFQTWTLVHWDQGIDANTVGCLFKIMANSWLRLSVCATWCLCGLSDLNIIQSGEPEQLGYAED